MREFEPHISAQIPELQEDLGAPSLLPQAPTEPNTGQPDRWQTADERWQRFKVDLDEAGFEPLVRRFASYSGGRVDVRDELEATAIAAAWEFLFTWRPQDGDPVKACLAYVETVLRAAVNQAYRSHDQRMKGPRQSRSLDAPVWLTDDEEVKLKDRLTQNPTDRSEINSTNDQTLVRPSVIPAETWEVLEPEEQLLLSEYFAFPRRNGENRWARAQRCGMSFDTYRRSWAVLRLKLHRDWQISVGNRPSQYPRESEFTPPSQPEQRRPTPALDPQYPSWYSKLGQLVQDRPELLEELGCTPLETAALAFLAREPIPSNATMLRELGLTPRRYGRLINQRLRAFAVRLLGFEEVIPPSKRSFLPTPGIFPEGFWQYLTTGERRVLLELARGEHRTRPELATALGIQVLNLGEFCKRILAKARSCGCEEQLRTLPLWS